MYWGLTPQQQPGSYQGGEMMMIKSVFWWRKPEYPEETTDLWRVTDEIVFGGVPFFWGGTGGGGSRATRKPRERYKNHD